MFDWQTIVVLLAVAAAGGWILWQVRRSARDTTGCGSGCGTCSLADSSKS
ncbi:MAG: hypothetical protein B7Z55_13640, partial [Planctomycetales bacterium 12-60-4]